MSSRLQTLAGNVEPVEQPGRCPSRTGPSPFIAGEHQSTPASAGAEGDPRLAHRDRVAHAALEVAGHRTVGVLVVDVAEANVGPGGQRERLGDGRTLGDIAGLADLVALGDRRLVDVTDGTIGPRRRDLGQGRRTRRRTTTISWVIVPTLAASNRTLPAFTSLGCGVSVNSSRVTFTSRPRTLPAASLWDWF